MNLPRLRVVPHMSEIREATGWWNDERLWSRHTTMDSEAGEKVNEETALKWTAVLQALRRISGIIAMLPKTLIFEEPGKPETRRDAPEHPAYRIMKHQANPLQTPFEMFEQIQGCLMMYGQCYAQIQRNPAGKPMALWFVPPTEGDLEFDGEGKFGPVDGLGLRIKATNRNMEWIPDRDLFRLRGFTPFGGLVGLSPIRLGRDAIGLALAQERSASSYFKNGARPSGILSTEQTPKKPDRDLLVSSWNDAHGGSGKHHKTPFLFGGLTYQALSDSPDDSQMNESRTWQLGEVARLWDVPLYMLWDLTNANFANIWQMRQDLVDFCLMNALVRIEDRLDHDLLTEEERLAGYKFKINVKGLLRGDPKMRGEFYNVMRQGGAITPNEIRAKEDEPPLPGKQGDVTTIPVNMVPGEVFANMTLDGGSDEARTLERGLLRRRMEAVVGDRSGDLSSDLKAFLPEFDRAAARVMGCEPSNGTLDVGGFVKRFMESVGDGAFSVGEFDNAAAESLWRDRGYRNFSRQSFSGNEFVVVDLGKELGR